MATINFNGQEMYVGTNETKKQFIEKAKNMAKHYETLRGFYTKVFCPVVEAFNGKPANARFQLAMQQGAMELDENIQLSSVSSYDASGHGSMNVNTAYAGGSCSHWILLSVEQRYASADALTIDAAATMQRNKPLFQKSKEEELQAMADGCRDSIEHYDEYMEQVADLIQRIGSYNNLPSCFRGHIMRHCLNVY